MSQKNQIASRNVDQLTSQPSPREQPERQNLVSVIIRTRNRPELLQEALRSVSTQTYTNIEVVVVNDGGQDVAECIQSFTDTAITQLHYIDLQPGQGRAAAANTGLEQATGKYLIFLDDDDWFLPEHIAVLENVLTRKRDARVVYTGIECRQQDASGNWQRVHVFNEPFDPIRLLIDNYIPIHAAMFRRDLFDRGCRFDESLEVFEDWDFWLQLARETPFTHVNQISAVYRIGGTGGFGVGGNNLQAHKSLATFLTKWRGCWSIDQIVEIALYARHRNYLYEQLKKEVDGWNITAKDRSIAIKDEQIADLSSKNATLDTDNAALKSQQTELEHRIEVLDKQLTANTHMIASQAQWLNDERRQLQSIYNSRAWRWTRPLVYARWWLREKRRIWRRHPRLAHSVGNAPGVPVGLRVDVIIPVYKGLAETRRCIESVLHNRQQISCNVIVINDASPEPGLPDYLADLATAGHIELLNNKSNLGFVETVNRGMALNPDHDVLLLNSDTEVAGDWLDRIVRCAYSADDIGTVTPFSNNATICSYPRSCQANSLPEGWSLEALDTLFRSINTGEYIDIPTGVGFCMYIRRICLQEVGSFDAIHFGTGYGEENDFCVRAAERSWRHVLCADTFVYHAGGVSFAERQDPRKEKAMVILRNLHPDYEPAVHAYITEDPGRRLRFAIDIVRLMQSDRPVILFITHNLEGGTEKHIQDLVQLFSNHLNVLTLRPVKDGEYTLQWIKDGEAFELSFFLPGDYAALCRLLQEVQVKSVHFHHTINIDTSVWKLPADLGIAYDYTAHDYYSICPQINLVTAHARYCGEPNEIGCNRCLRITPPPGRETIQAWRERYRPFLEHARHVFAPSQDVARRLQRHFPSANVVYAQHPEESVTAAVEAPPPVGESERLRIVILGALSEIKGADTLEACALDAENRNLDLEFHLLGYGYRSLLIESQDSRLVLYGPYTDDRLPYLLEAVKPHVAWFPAQWPETHSYTLSACLRAGLPIVAPDLGAFSERLYNRPWTWLHPWQTSARAWNDFFMTIRAKHFRDGTAPVPPSGNVDGPKFSYRDDYLASETATTVNDSSKDYSTLLAMLDHFETSRRKR